MGAYNINYLSTSWYVVHMHEYLNMVFGGLRPHNARIRIMYRKAA